MSAPRSLPALLFDQARRRGAALAIRHKSLGIWRRVSWAEYAGQVGKVAAALVAFGLRRGEKVSILGDNRPEWLYCHLGIMAAGGATCGIYPTSSAEQIEYLLAHSESRLIFLENEEQLEKVLPILDRDRDRAGAPTRRVVVWDAKGLWGYADARVTLYGDFLGEGARPAAQEAAAARLAEVGPEDTAMVIYTSGTTGPPKGAMISHGNALFMAESLLDANRAAVGDEVISYLPLAHVYENLGSVMQHVRVGYVVNFVESLETLFQNLREVSPTYFASVPRVWEKLASTIDLRMEDAPPLKRALYKAAVAVGKRWVRARRQGRAGPLLGAGRFAAYWLVLEPLKRRIGFDRVRMAISGAAPAAPELFDYFQALGVPLMEGYGMTESSGVIAVNRLERARVGTVGEPLPGVEVKLAEDGEILTRGPHLFQGYFKDPAQTAEAIDREGWLHTGDIGALEDGYLRIVDRKKDILITAGGKNIAPAYIENKLKFSPYIQDAVVVGDRRKYVVALILIDEDNVTRFAQEQRLPFADFAELTQAPEVVRLIGQEVEKVNKVLSQVESVKRFALLPRRFYEEEGDVTPTKKVKRRNIERRYADLVESLYRG